MSAQLTVQRITKTFRTGDSDVVALSHISLEVKAGEVLMLVGPSGCGKSTLLNVIAGLEHADSGSIAVDGRLIDGPGPDRAVVFQDGALFPWLTVRKNVEFGLRQLGVDGRERERRADAFLDRIGLAGFENRNIHELSGGMRQRVAIARALVTNPKVVLMDEPFSALDALTREDLYDQMQELWRVYSTTVIFVTHNVREAVVLGDRIVLMTPRPGRIQNVFDVGILPPRQVDDVDVARLAKRISMELKFGIGLGASVDGGCPMKWVRTIGFYLVLLAVWEVVALRKVWDPMLFPGPGKVVGTLWDIARDGTLLNATAVSLRRVFLGYGISMAIGLPLGIMLATNKWVNDTIGSLVSAFQSLPSICWLPLALLWFGLNDKAILFVVVMGSLVSIATAVKDGVKNLPPTYLRAARTMGTPSWRIYTEVLFPASQPAVLTAAKLGWSYAWRALMSGELLFVSLGLGHILMMGRELADMSQVLSVMIVIMALGLGSEHFLFGPMENQVRRRWGFAI